MMNKETEYKIPLGGRRKYATKEEGYEIHKQRVAARNKKFAEKFKEEQKRYYENNKEEIRARSKEAYHNASPEKKARILEYQRQWRIDNRDTICEAARIRYAENKEKVLAKARERYNENIDESREKAKEKAKRYYELHKAELREKSRLKYHSMTDEEKAVMKANAKINRDKRNAAITPEERAARKEAGKEKRRLARLQEIANHPDNQNFDL